MEQIRESSVKIKLYVDTNKRTIDEEFDSFEELIEFTDGIEIMGATLTETLGLSNRRQYRVLSRESE